ncbi:polar amino acid transport system substrate-binding protein [Lipingzhangella halophila]|uniref:Polar amino acid transport system substrate-binding protein n=1 Tax=Lipingzhangella halophila TaxID=1783352 RepID=A0A7W7W149_9ACTN|nr:ABC transporter substrate-binding protein [Lipingzhangella halophila]MBB4929953.1 polar amino acid transport system substrate-binding protein [Lipingzhangella halophila]
MAMPRQAKAPLGNTLVGGLALTLALTGCGSGDDEDGGGIQSELDVPPPPEVEADPDLADMVPEDYREQGTLTVGADSSYAPGEFLDADGETVIGYNVELFDAVAAKLDLDTEWQESTFGTIIEGVDSGKYDVGSSSFTINEDRMEQVTMVSYYVVGTQWFTAAGNPENVDPDNACGMSIAVQRDTIQVPDLETRSEQCEDDGDPAIDIQQYERQDQATEAIMSGKNDAGLADMPVALYAVERTDGQLETLGEQYEAAPYGVLVNPEETELAEAIAAGYQSIMDDGTYEEILGNWELSDQGTLDTSEVNPDVSEFEDAETDE